jgi:hypothetical protein
VGDDYFKIAYLRTRSEFSWFWQRERNNISHLIITAHGRRDAIRFIGGTQAPDFEDWMTGHELGEFVDQPDALAPIHLLSLACRTGYAEFAGQVSSAASCRDCVGPLHDVHGAIATQFCQTLFVEHLLHGRTWPIAFRHARQSTPGVSTFRLWAEGRLREGATGR